MVILREDISILLFLTRDNFSSLPLSTRILGYIINNVLIIMGYNVEYIVNNVE